MSTKQPAGFILYQGPSMLDGSPIVAIAITRSTNRKTGNMVQTYIIRADVNPVQALKTGGDSSVCGDCKHRPILGGACYVNVGQGPRAVFEAYRRGNYPAASHEAGTSIADIGAGRIVRLGTYGDPAAVPAYVWQALTERAAGHTGYTHQWANPALSAEHRADIGRLCMASADTPAERLQALAQGLRTFRVRTDDAPIMSGEFVCPASAEAGKRRTCDTCKACDGTSRGTVQASPVIIAHGSKASRFARVIALKAV